MSKPSFKQLNDGWNAEPNAPSEEVVVTGTTVRLIFFLNHMMFDAEEEEEGRIIFDHCSMWRLGSTNDHGWYAGQCRYSKDAPAWGEFYELLGKDDRRLEPTDWHKLATSAPDERHFLFYLRDNTFECFATEWRFERGPSVDDQPSL